MKLGKEVPDSTNQSCATSFLFSLCHEQKRWSSSWNSGTHKQRVCTSSCRYVNMEVHTTSSRCLWNEREKVQPQIKQSAESHPVVPKL